MILCFPSPLYILDINTLLGVELAKTLPPVCGLPFLWTDCFFRCTTAFSCTRSHLTAVGLNFWADGDFTQKVLSYTYISCRYCLCFVLPVSDFIFRPLIYLELFFVQCDEYLSNFILLHVGILFSQHLLLKILSFLECIFLACLSTIRRLQLHVLMFGSFVWFQWFTQFFFWVSPDCLFLLWLCSTSWGLKWQRLQHFSFRSGVCWLSGVFMVPCEFQSSIFSIFVNDELGILIGIVLNL